MPASIDVIAGLTGISPGSALAELRAGRPEATEHAQLGYTALFDPPELAGLSAVERLATALRVAISHAEPAIAAHYRLRLTQADPAIVIAVEIGAEGSLPPRLRAILRHAELLSRRPEEARPEHLRALAAPGLTIAEIATVAQLVGFVGFQLRLVVGLRLLGGITTTVIPPVPSVPRSRSARTRPVRSPTASAAIRKPAPATPIGFTRERLGWLPWLATADLSAQPGVERERKLLAHAPELARTRDDIENGILRSPGGADWAERELAATVVARRMDSVYRTSVHARRTADLSGKPEEVDRVLRLGVTPGLDLGFGPRWEAIVGLASALTVTPPVTTPSHVQLLRTAGLNELEILDLVQAAALASWTTRVSLGLGEPYRPFTY